MIKRKLPSRKTIIIAILIAGIFYFGYYSYRSTYKSTVGSQSNSTISQMDVKNFQPINNPKFESLKSADQYINNNARGIIFHNRFYPLQILSRHGIINSLESESVFISYSPLCDDGKVFSSNINGEVIKFENSNQILHNEILISDTKSHSLWSPILSKSTEGSLKNTELQVQQSEIISWEDFKKQFQNGMVLSRDTGFKIDYTKNLYENYQKNSDIYYPVTNLDARMPAKQKYKNIFWFCFASAFPNTIIDSQK